MHMEIVIFFGIGFFAQLIDGALGMAFGAISTTALLSFGLSPLHASAIVHTAEVVTTGASSAAHIVQKNLTRKLVIELALAGSVGAIIGAYVLSHAGKQIAYNWGNPKSIGDRPKHESKSETADDRCNQRHFVEHLS